MRGEVLPKCQEAAKEWKSNLDKHMKKIKETPISWKQTAIWSACAITFCYALHRKIPDFISSGASLLFSNNGSKIPVGVEEVASTIKPSIETTYNALMHIRWR